MHGDRIAERSEAVEHYDIFVRSDGDGAEIVEIEEHDDLSEDEMNVLLTELEIKYGLSIEFVGAA